MADRSSYPVAICSLTILSQAFNVYDVPGDGNCLFHSISLSLHGNFHHSWEYRRRVCEFVSNNWAQWEEKVLLCHGLILAPFTWTINSDFNSELTLNPNKHYHVNT